MTSVVSSVGLAGPKSTPLATIASAVVVIASLLLPPGIYGVVAYHGVTADMRADARVANEVVHEAMAGAPETWQAGKAAIEQHIAGHIIDAESGEDEWLAVLDTQGQPVAVVGTMPAAPRLTWSMPVLEAGKTVGRIEVVRSLRPLIVNAALLSLLGIALAVVSYIAFRVIPLRTLLRANESLGERTEALAREIEEHKRGEAALRESQQIIRAILDTVPARIFWKDKDLVYLGCNEAFARDAGFSRPEDVVGKDDYQMGWRDQAELYRKDDQEVVDSGQSKLLIEEPQTTPDGKVITLLTSKVPLRDVNGDVFGVLGTYMDVTERQRAQEALRQSEERFKAIFDNAGDGIVLADAETKRFVAANKSLCRMLGYSLDEVTQLTVNDLHPKESLPAVIDAFEKQARGEIELAAGLPVKRKDGSVFFADIVSRPVMLSGQTYLLGVFRDISERKAAEDRIRFANSLLQAELESAPDGVFVVHSNPQALSFNRNFIEMWSIPPDVERSNDPNDVLTAVLPQLKDATNLERDVRHLRADPGAAVRFQEVELKDGRTVEYFGRSVEDESGAPLARIWFFRDITERKRAAEALAQSEARFKAIFDNAHDGIALTDPVTKKFLLGNAYLCRMLGYTAEEFARLAMSDIHPAEAMSAVLDEFKRHERGEQRLAADIPLKRKDGSVFYADVNSALVDIGGKHYVLGIFRDATARREAEEAVRKSEERYRSLVESTTDYIWEVDRDARYTYYTPAIARVLGYGPDEIMGKTPFELMPPAEAERVAATFGPIAAAHRPFSMLENTVLAKDGTEIVMETSGVPIFDDTGDFRGYRGIERDVTQRKAAEQELKQRDSLLHAVASGATELVTAPSLDEAIPKALETISRALQVDRMNVLERSSRGNPVPRLRYSWNAPGLEMILNQEFFDDPSLGSPEIMAWQSPLYGGKIVTAELRTASGDMKKMLQRLDVKSLLVVPVMVDGKYWGQIGFDNCKNERSWRDFEIEILTTVGDLIGNAIQRDRYVTEISNANRIVQNSPTVLYRLRGVPSLPMVYISQNIKLFGYEPAMLVESPHLYQDLIHPDDMGEVREKQAQMLESHNPRGVFEFRLMTSRGDYRWVENRYSQIHDSTGRLTEIEGLLIDITERKTAEEKIARLARTDPLTGLANRTTFVERLQQSFVAARRGAPAFALLYIDLDRFKDINDTLGHPVGDAFLIEVARRLKDSIRDADLAGRLGGDEFAVLQGELAESADAGTLATKIRDALAEPYQIGGNTLHMTASIGIAIYEFETKTAEDLLAQADIALYRAKEEGRDQYRFHTEELDIEVREQVELANELRGALSRGEFRLLYQPQVELSSGHIVGMEALIRWQHPTRGLLSPSAFLPVAERTGTIAAIGRWVLDSACAQMMHWREEGCAPATLAVNISPTEIKAGDEFIEFVRATLAKWELAPENLELDVTESMLARATLTQNDVLERLQQIGVKISIDDFGTKYSSLDYLRTYRVNRLKIPKSLTSTATQDPENAAMVRAIVGIARELGIEVIAQGVETEREWSFLTATSPVSKVQGYYYSEPVPADRAQQLLRGGRLAPALAGAGSEAVAAAGEKATGTGRPR